MVSVYGTFLWLTSKSQQTVFQEILFCLSLSLSNHYQGNPSVNIFKFTNIFVAFIKTWLFPPCTTTCQFPLKAKLVSSLYTVASWSLSWAPAGWKRSVKTWSSLVSEGSELSASSTFVKAGPWLPVPDCGQRAGLCSGVFNLVSEGSCLKQSHSSAFISLFWPCK